VGYSRRSLSAVRGRQVLAVVERIHRAIDFRLPPLRFEEFLSRFDSYRVFEVDLPLGLDGQLFLSPDGELKTIYLRRQNPRPRLRFTLAHEIIHAELHFPEGKLAGLVACRTWEHGGDSRREALEREADFGAAALLMPMWMLARRLGAGARSLHEPGTVRWLARMFRVSEAAMQVQLRQYQGKREAS